MDLPPLTRPGVSCSTRPAKIFTEEERVPGMLPGDPSGWAKLLACSEWSAIQRASCCLEIPAASAALWQGPLGSPPQRNADGRKEGVQALWQEIPGAQIQKGPLSLATPCGAKGAGTALYSLQLALHSGHFNQQLQTYPGTLGAGARKPLPPPSPQGVQPYLGNSIFSSTCNSTLHATSRHK